MPARGIQSRHVQAYPDRRSGETACRVIKTVRRLDLQPLRSIPRPAGTHYVERTDEAVLSAPMRHTRDDVEGANEAVYFLGGRPRDFRDSP